MELSKEIQDKILLKKTRQDKNGRDYLILELEKGENIFIFDNKDTPSERWTELKETEEYIFTIKEGNKFGTNVLIGFESVDFIV